MFRPQNSSAGTAPPCPPGLWEHAKHLLQSFQRRECFTSPAFLIGGNALSSPCASCGPGPITRLWCICVHALCCCSRPLFRTFHVFRTFRQHVVPKVGVCRGVIEGCSEQDSVRGWPQMSYPLCKLRPAQRTWPIGPGPKGPAV